MKKLMFTIASICLFTATTYAQTPDIKLGIKAGINLADVSGISETQMKLGINVGVLAEVFFTEQFSVQPEIIYSPQGTKVEKNVPILGKITAKSNLDYINIPIIAKYYIIEGFNVQAGPQVGFLVNESSSLNGEEVPKNTDKSTNNSVDFGLGLGLGYELPIGLFIDARYNLGLTNISKLEGDNEKNQVIQVSVGFKF